MRLGLAVAANDTAAAVDVLLTWAGDSAVDRRGLEHDIAELIDLLRGVPLGQIDLADIVAPCLSASRPAIPIGCARGGMADATAIATFCRRT